MMPDLTTLKEPVFIEANWEELYREIISAYENVSGVKLSKGQLESILLSIFAYRENLLRILMNETAKQNLLAYAVGERLDHLAALFGIERLPARRALTTLRFHFSEPLSQPILIPQGTKVMSKDHKVSFETNESVNVQASSSYVDILASCQQPGTIGNGYLPGDINELIDPIPYVDKVENISISYGGADVEDDEHLRLRVQLAPEAFSNAGSRYAYEYWVRSAHQDIEDVVVISPRPGHVDVVLLMKEGEPPSDEIVNLVLRTLNDERVRPITDVVTVRSPEQVEYEISASLFIYKGRAAFSESIIERARASLEMYAHRVKKRIGRDVVPEQITAVLQEIDGVYRAVIEKPQYIELLPYQQAICKRIDVKISGVVND